MPTNSPDTSFSTPRSLGASLAAAVLLAAGAPCADASLLVYEGFDYTPGQTVSGNEGGIGFSQGWWTANLGSGSIQSGSLPSGSTPTSGHSASLETSFVGRPVDEIAGTAGTQTWTSFLFSTSVSTVSSSEYAASFVLSPVDGLDNALWIGAFADEFTGELYLGLGWSYNSPASLSSVAVVAGETYNLAVSIDWNAGDAPEAIRLYLNPPAGAAPDPGTAITTHSINLAPPWDTNTPNRISGIYMASMVEGDVMFDEIRIGDTFADVVPVPEPSTAGLVAIALGVFARFRVRRA